MKRLMDGLTARLTNGKSGALSRVALDLQIRNIANLEEKGNEIDYIRIGATELLLYSLQGPKRFLVSFSPFKYRYK